MVVLRCPCEKNHQLWGSFGGPEGNINGCSSMSTKRVCVTANRLRTVLSVVGRLSERNAR
jgi:hypothetical protein